MLKEEKDFKTLFKEAEITNSYFNPNNKHNSLKLVNKIQSLKKDFLSLEYPINTIIDFITNSQEIYMTQSKLDILLKEEETVYKLMK
jgi:hypothetical protein